MSSRVSRSQSQFFQRGTSLASVLSREVPSDMSIRPYTSLLPSYLMGFGVTEHWTGLAASDVAVLCIASSTYNSALAARHLFDEYERAR